MAKDAVYCFAQYPKEFGMCAGLANVIREVRPDLAVHLICASEPNSVGFKWESLSKIFDSVQWVDRAMQGAWRGRFNLVGLAWAFTKGFADARRVRNEMGKLRFEPNSVAFVFCGFSLNQSIFLQRVKIEPGMTSVMIAEQTDDALLSDFVLGYQESLYLNLFQRFFGTAYYDVFWLRTEHHNKTNQREYRFRNNPADYTFFGEHALRRSVLRPGQIYWPYYKTRHQDRSTNQKTVIVYGGIYEWIPLISMDPFYRRYNELLELIRRKHKGQRLLYLEHPGQSDERAREVERLDLHGYEIVHGISSEAIVNEDPSITTAYAVVSTALFTTAALGVRAHFLYRLFDESSIPGLLKQRLDARWASEIHPEMCLSSVDRWLSGQSDYEVESSSDRVRAATSKLLEVVSVVNSKEAVVIGDETVVTAETRWQKPMAAWSLMRWARAIVGIPETYSVRRRIGRAFSSPVRLARKVVLREKPQV